MNSTYETLDTDEPKEMSALSAEAALRRASAYLARLAKNPDFLGTHVSPLLEGARDSEGWHVARRLDAADGSYSLQVFVWPPGSGTKVHDHGSWGAYLCAAGSILEERYERLDDGSIADHVRLKKVWELTWTGEDGASTVLPGDEGIHRISNPNDEPAVSIHLYGPRTEERDGRDYDPSRHYVRDRREEPTPEGGVPIEAR